MALEDAETGMPDVNVSPDKHVRRDLRQLETAIKKWNVPESLIQKTLQRIESVVDNEDTKAREMILAAKVVNSMIQADNTGPPPETCLPEINIYIPANGREAS